MHVLVQVPSIFVSLAFFLYSQPAHDIFRDPQQPSAADVVNFASVESLHEIFSRYGEETSSRKIAKTIDVYRRNVGQITTTKQLADVISWTFDDG